jgi:hypothetical protein
MNVHNFIKDSYKGGITNLFKPYCKNGIMYDINSSYPASMLKDMPEGKAESINGYDITMKSFFGFVRVTVEVDESEYNPMLSIKTTNGLIYPVGRFTTIVFSEELKYAIKHTKTKIIKIHHGYKYNRYNGFFRGFVEGFYNDRMKAKDNNRKGEALILKLLLNGLYGRFGIGIEYDKTTIIHETELKKYLQYTTVVDYNKFNNKYIVKYNTAFEKKNG